MLRPDAELGCVLTMRFGSTAKVPLKCKLKYYRNSECVLASGMSIAGSLLDHCWCSHRLSRVFRGLSGCVHGHCAPKQENIACEALQILLFLMPSPVTYMASLQQS